MDTRHIPDAIEIVAFDISAPDGTRLYSSIEHAGQANVDSINRLTRHLQRNIEALLFGSQQREFIGRLDFDLRWIGQRCSGRLRSDSAIRRPALGLRMGYDSALCHQPR